MIGSSTGGVEALRFLLPRLPGRTATDRGGTAHPTQFFAGDGRAPESALPLRGAQTVQDEELRPGLCLVAPIIASQ